MNVPFALHFEHTWHFNRDIRDRGILKKPYTNEKTTIRSDAVASAQHGSTRGLPVPSFVRGGRDMFQLAGADDFSRDDSAFFLELLGYLEVCAPCFHSSLQAYGTP